MKVAMLALLAGMAMPIAVDTARAESLADVEFAGPTLTVYEDKGGKPGKANTKIQAEGINRTTSEFLDYDKSTRMFRIRLSSGETGWVRKATFKPLPKTSPLCKDRKPQLAQAATGKSADSKIAGGQALAEELCL